MNALARLEGATRALAEAGSLDEVKQIMDLAEAAATYARAAKLGLEAQNYAAEIKLRAERKAGEILARLERTPPQRANLNGHNQHGGEVMSNVGHDLPSPYATALVEGGATRQDAARWQETARIPEPEFEEHIAATKSRGAELTSAGVRRAARVVARSGAERDRKRRAVPAGAATVAHADALAWLSSLAPESADVLLTDPPYMTDVPDVAAFAAAWVPLALSRVKPSGRAYIFTGAYPAELAAYLAVLGGCAGWALDNILVWTYRNTLGPSPKMGYKLNWQACFHLYGPDAPPLDCPSMVEQFSVQDIAAPDGRQGNRLHTWQKPDEIAERFIRHSSRPGDLVLDPFAGTGTFLAAAARLGRVAMGCEIDSEMIAICEERGVARVEVPCAR